MSLLTSNNLKLLIASAVGTGDTSIDLISAAGLPDVSSISDWTIITLIRNVDQQYEIVKVTNIVGNTLTVERAQEGTSALTFAGGDSVRNYFTSGMFNQFTFEATAAAASEAAAAVSATNADLSQTAAELAESFAAVSEVAAQLAATNAQTSATNASASETAAGLSETAAALSETNAGTSETNSAASAAAALVSENNAAATLTNSVKLSASMVDNALIKGDGTSKDSQVTGIIVDDSDNVNGLGSLTVGEMAAPSTPASGNVVVYAKTDGALYIKNDAGDEFNLTEGGGFPSTDEDKTAAFTVVSGNVGNSIVFNSLSANVDCTLDVSLLALGDQLAVINEDDTYRVRVVVSNTGTMTIGSVGIDLYLWQGETVLLGGDTSTNCRILARP